MLHSISSVKLRLHKPVLLYSYGDLSANISAPPPSPAHLFILTSLTAGMTENKGDIMSLESWGNEQNLETAGMKSPGGFLLSWLTHTQNILLSPLLICFLFIWVRFMPTVPLLPCERAHTRT